MNKIISYLKEPLVLFLIKAIGIWLVWMLVYGIVFKKEEINDPITSIEANLTATFFKAMGYNVSLSNNHFATYKNLEGEEKSIHNKQYIIINNQPIVGIASACNGVELFALFIGFLISFGGRKKLWQFLSFGLISIFLLNTFRIIAITWITMFNREQAEFHHHYTFMFVVYGYILWLWHKWTTMQNTNKQKEDEK